MREQDRAEVRVIDQNQPIREPRLLGRVQRFQYRRSRRRLNQPAGQHRAQCATSLCLTHPIMMLHDRISLGDHDIRGQNGLRAATQRGLAVFC